MLEKNLVDSLEAQLNDLRKDLQSLLEAKKKPEEGHWITVHSDGGHGTHIFIKGDGTVGKGPANLVGKSIKTAAKKASKKPVTKSSGELGIGGSMASTSSLPSSGGMVDISKYQTSIPLTPAAPKAAAKPTAPKSPKVETPKAGPQNIDIGGYKFDMPKIEAPKPPEPPKVEAPKPLEAPKPATPEPLKDEHEHWTNISKSKYIGTVKKGTHIPGNLNTIGSGGITDSNAKTTGDVHVFDSAVAAMSAKGKDLEKDPKNTNLYAYPSKGIHVYDDKDTAQKAHAKALLNNISFIKLKNAIDGKHAENLPEKALDLAGKATQMTPKGNYLHPVEPKTFSTHDEAFAAYQNEWKDTYDKLIASGASSDFADELTKKVHPQKSYIVKGQEAPQWEPPKKLTPSPSEPPKHGESSEKKNGSAVPDWYASSPTPGSEKSKQPAFNLLANPTGVRGGLFVQHGEVKKFPSHEEAAWAFQSDFQTTIRNLKKSGMSSTGAALYANQLMDHKRYKVDESIASQSKATPPEHTSWQYDDTELRPTTNNAQIKELTDKHLPSDIVQAVQNYSGSHYKELNRSLYNMSDMSITNQDLKNKLDQFIDLCGIQKKPITVWRGIRSFNPEGDTNLKKVTHQELLERFKRNIGNVITLDGFQSASIKPSSALAFSGAESDPEKFIFEIKTRHGGRMGKSLSHSPEEAEFLLGHGWNYKVVGIEKVPFSSLLGSPNSSRTIVKLEHIP